MFSSLLKLFNEFVDLTLEEEQLITASFKPLTLSKGDFLLVVRVLT